MATVITTNNKNVGHGGVAVWSAVFDSTSNETDTVVVDLSTLEYTSNIKVQEVFISASEGVGVTVEIGTGIVAYHPDTATGPTNVCFYSAPDGGISGAADVLVTTTGVAAGNGVYVKVIYRVD